MAYESSRWIAWATFFCLAATACGDDDSGGRADAADDPVDAAAPDAASSCPPGELYWPMTMRHESRNGPVVAGVHVCVLDRDDIPCGDSAADGTWATCLPPDSDIAFTFEKAGYISGLGTIHTPLEPPATERGRWTTIIHFTDQTTRQHWEDVLGLPYPPTDQGYFWINTFQNEPDAAMFPAAMGGVSAAFDPPAASGPMYQDLSGAYDPAATATNVIFPSIWAALDPDPDQTVTLSHPTLDTCAHLDGGWTGDNANELRVPIRAGFRTYVPVTCY